MNMHKLPIVEDDITHNSSNHKGYYYVGQFKVSIYKTVRVYIRVAKPDDYGCNYDYIVE